MKCIKAIGAVAFICLLSSLFASSLFSQTASAAQYGQTYFERATLPGYIGDYYARGGNALDGSVVPNVYPSIDTYAGNGAIGTKALGISMSDSNQTKKQALYDFLRQKNLNGSEWEKMGTALVVHQMIGRPWHSGGRYIAADDPAWAELKRRLVDNTAVIMDRFDYQTRYNTIGVMVNGRYDAIKYDNPGYLPLDAWVFRVNGEIVYALEIICANPMGDLGGLPDNPPPPPPEYLLEPSVSFNRDNNSVVEPGDTTRVTNRVENTGADDSVATIWRLTKMVYEPGRSLSNAEKAARPNSGSDPCTAFPSNGRSECDASVQENLAKIFIGGQTATFSPQLNYTLPSGTPVGTKVCFAVSVSRPTYAATPLWSHSAWWCMTVGKKPKMQVWGGDVRAGGKIDTSIVTTQGTTYGSWGEYGALSVRSNSGFGSGAGLNEGNGSSIQSAWDNLTFANSDIPSGCDGDFGCYQFTPAYPALVSQFIQPATPELNGARNLNSLASGTYRAGNLRLTGNATVSSGKTIVIVSSGTVRIEGDITYEDIQYTNIRNIPQVVIKAPRIEIQGNVGRVDAWLLAVSSDNRGVLNTCSDVGVNAQLTANICNNRLMINGPVVADTVYLRRTAGSGGQPDDSNEPDALDERGDPAEIFNLRADAYLWAHAYGSGTSRIQTVYTKELSPRF